MVSRMLFVLVLSLIFVLGFGYGFGEEIPSFTVSDRPGDEGGSIEIKWDPISKTLPIVVQRSTYLDSGFISVGSAFTVDGKFVDSGLKDETPYYYRLLMIAGQDTIYSSVFGPVQSRSNWFRMQRLNALVLTALMFAFVVLFIEKARRGGSLFIRKIAGLNALEEAVGRATEMGRKILYIPGILSVSEIQTIASLSILGYLSKLTANYGANIEVANKDPLTYSAARETVKQAYIEAGKPDQFKESMVTYITYDQFAYSAAVTGKMVRERPAANFLIGSFFAESLILAETGYSIGAIQIAGTADLPQLPFFVTACDYTLIGEELFAASAYLSKEPVLVGSIKAQDVIKAIIMVIIGLGIITYSAGLQLIRDLLLTQ